MFQTFMKSIKQFTVSRNAGENFAKGSISHSLFNVFCYKNWSLIQALENDDSLHNFFYSDKLTATN